MSSFRIARRWLRRRARALLAQTVIASLSLQLIGAALPPAAPSSPVGTSAANAETLGSPRYVSAAVMPNGQVGLLYANGDNGVNTAAEIRFTRYTGEHAIAGSAQLSTAGPAYPQLATFRGRLVAGYVDSRAPNDGRFVVRASDDNGATWSVESHPFGSATFDRWMFAPRLVASRDGQTLYFFYAMGGAVPTYRSTTDATLATWTAAAAAGDASMRAPSGNNCGNSGAECYRAHAYSFMETAAAGTWVYVTKSDSGWGQSGRGTQVGTLGGSWSAQVDHGGSGGISGCCGESTATTFLGRDGSVYYIRAGTFGEYVYFKRSSDGGSTWGAEVHLYSPNVANYLAAAPVGLYVGGYTFGEYVWYAGFGGSENALRVVPLWTGAKAYAQTGTVRLVGSAGSDLDPGSAYPFNFGDAPRALGAGTYTTGAVDLALPGRILPLVLARTYSSADTAVAGPLGPGWTHSFEWSLTENAALVTLKRGDGSRVKFTRGQDGTYAREPGVFDVLAKNGDATFTLTTRDQTKYEFASTGVLVRIHEPAGNQLRFAYAYVAQNLVRSPLSGVVSYGAIEQYSSDYQPGHAANGVRTNGTGAGVSWAAVGWSAGDWWRVSWSAPQALSRVRLWDRSPDVDYFGAGRLRFSDGSVVTWSGLPNDPGAGENYLEVSFPRKSGITWLEVVADTGGFGNGGLAEVEAYDDTSPTSGARGTSVLGHYPEYLDEAERLGAHRYSVPKRVWDRWTEAEQWAANARFLDRVARRGDEVVLTTPVDEIVSGSWLWREVQYLIERGYRVASEGTRLLPPD